MPDKILQVAVGVIVNSDNEVLISKRSSNVHQADLWEFPGGKIEAGETTDQALCRELKEELGIDIAATEYLNTVVFDYGDKKVCLNTCLVKEFKGQPKGLEGQPVKWVSVSDLNHYRFPAANVAIINRLQFPDQIQITGEYSTTDNLLNKTRSCFDKKINVLHFRAHNLNDVEYIAQAKALLSLCRENGVKLVLNRSLEVFNKIEADGLHLNRHEMKRFANRPCAVDKLFSVSCHNEFEIKYAQKLEADYCLLSPVKPAFSHETAQTLGWNKFKELVALSNVPVYALGGMMIRDINEVKKYGGQGVASISEYWK